MNDNEYLQQFEACTLPPEQFKHRGHLRIAWLYLNKYPLEDAKTYITQGIKRYATHLGAAHIYNEELTLKWISIIHAAMRKNPGKDFQDFIHQNPQFFDKSNSGFS